ncbi:hypothetical protein JOY44_27715 (plasmid) [Phormidium sp. CLA17]|uniref:DUF3592 domain-containing protein n=1 Tax=Leptolyngbya sp. Cla-17 TaxID=2803751 RepID=UPI00149327BB|nr:DUF3592 domain-containing protein [Leptolyngbya sp. Cla-17]MBM0745262.1 hypothetical protein [Leptolyngbya sp. Cla-17]
MQSISRNQLNLIGIFTLMIGAGFLLTAGVLTASTYRFVAMASRSEGRVIRLTTRNLEPVIRFVPAGSTNAVEFVGKIPITGVMNRYGVGDKVPVLYLKDGGYPSGFQTGIDTIGALWSLQLFYAVLGTSAIFNGLRVKRLASRQS